MNNYLNKNNYNILLVCSNDGTSEIWVLLLIISESLDTPPSDGVDKCFTDNFVLSIIDFSLFEVKFCCELVDDGTIDFVAMVFSCSSI